MYYLQSPFSVDGSGKVYLGSERLLPNICIVNKINIFMLSKLFNRLTGIVTVMTQYW